MPRLTLCDISQRVDDNPLALLYSDDFCRAIRHTTVVDESGDSTFLRCVNDCVLIDPEEVTAPDTAL